MKLNLLGTNQENGNAPYLAWAPLFIVLGALTAFDILSGLNAIVIWLSVAATCGWVMSRYSAAVEQANRQLRILLADQSDNAPEPKIINTPLTDIIDSLTDPFVLLTTERRVAHVNKAARDILGDRVVAKDISFYFRNPIALKTIDLTLQDGAERAQEISVLDPIERVYLMRTSLIKNPIDSVNATDVPAQYLLISFLDITRIKQSEKMRVDFVANASHELRTPLAAILGFIETLQGPAANDSKARERFLGIMFSEATRMQRLIDDLLSLSRIELDQHVTPVGKIELAPLLANLTNTIELREKRQSSIFKLDLENLPAVSGDRDQLVQVFQNLIDNALKYGRADEPILITARKTDRLPGRPGSGILISIFNAGDGIPAEHLPRLTERFYRVDTARSRQIGGTGLGLAIVKHIITRHRGTLQIESTLGVGTTFSIYLPDLASQERANNIRKNA